MTRRTFHEPAAILGAAMTVWKPRNTNPVARHIPGACSRLIDGRQHQISDTVALSSGVSGIQLLQASRAIAVIGVNHLLFYTDVDSALPRHTGVVATVNVTSECIIRACHWKAKRQFATNILFMICGRFLYRNRWKAHRLAELWD